jgi:hypothetical protein
MEATLKKKEEEELKVVHITKNTNDWLKSNLTKKEYTELIDALSEGKKPENKKLAVLYSDLMGNAKENKDGSLTVYLTKDNVVAFRAIENLNELGKIIPSIIDRKYYATTVNIGALTYVLKTKDKLKSQEIGDLLTDFKTKAEHDVINKEYAEEFKKNFTVYAVMQDGKMVEKEPTKELLAMIGKGEFTDVKPLEEKKKQS